MRKLCVVENNIVRRFGVPEETRIGGGAFKPVGPCKRPRDKHTDVQNQRPGVIWRSFASRTQGSRLLAAASIPYPEQTMSGSKLSATQT